ncbi:MAG TPA: HipA family kinase [Candidatus Limnocylindria bacterium]
MALKTVEATRYVMPLREGGSLPGLVEASDDGLYVVKFRGAAQGPKALVAEVVAGELGRALGFNVPALVRVELDPQLANAEPDQELQDLLERSGGTNLGVDFLPGALPFNPAASRRPAAELAADVVWLDALVTNVDRTARNTNLLTWHRNLWLIDHGASLYFHHAPARTPGDERTPFPLIAQHVLLPFAGSIRDADARLAGRVTRDLLEQVASTVPAEWLDDVDVGTYVTYLERRLAEPRDFVDEAERARER